MRHIKRTLYLTICFLIIALCCCCKGPKYIEVPVETIRTEYIVNKDSIYIHDSIWTLIDRAGDTVYIEKFKLKYKTIYKTDTVCKTDTIPKIVKVTETIEVNKLRKWQKGLMWLGVVFIIIVGGSIIYKFGKWKLLS